MISASQGKFIHVAIWAIVTRLREETPDLTPGEIYDAIAEELEYRCKAVIERRNNTDEIQSRS